MNTIRKSLVAFGLGMVTFSTFAYETIYVTDYGALPDDGQDDAAAINWAISTAPDDAWVYLPAGTYEITHAILAKSNIKLAGEGQDSTIIRYTGTSGDAMIFSDGAANVEISDMTLDADHNPSAWQGIAVLGGSGHYVGDLTIKNFVATDDWGPHAILLADVTHSSVAYNVIQDIAPDD